MKNVLLTILVMGMGFANAFGDQCSENSIDQPSLFAMNYSANRTEAIAVTDEQTKEVVIKNMGPGKSEILSVEIFYNDQTSVLQEYEGEEVELAPCEVLTFVTPEEKSVVKVIVTHMGPGNIVITGLGD